MQPEVLARQDGLEVVAKARRDDGLNRHVHVAVGQNPVLVNIKIGGKWMFIHPKMEP